MFVVTRGAGDGFTLPGEVSVRVSAVRGDTVELALEGPADMLSWQGERVSRGGTQEQSIDADDYVLLEVADY